MLGFKTNIVFIDYFQIFQLHGGSTVFYVEIYYIQYYFNQYPVLPPSNSHKILQNSIKQCLFWYQAFWCLHGSRGQSMVEVLNIIWLALIKSSSTVNLSDKIYYWIVPLIDLWKVEILFGHYAKMKEWILVGPSVNDQKWVQKSEKRFGLFWP